MERRSDGGDDHDNDNVGYALGTNNLVALRDR